MRRPLAITALAVGLVVCGSARSQGICVTCEEPAGSYACNVEHWEKLQKFRGGSQLASMACIKDIAQRYGHARCGVRTGVAGPCIGPAHTVTVNGENPPQSTAGAPPAAPPAVAAPTDSKPKPESETPKTVAELAKKATKDSQTQIEKAGEAVGSAVKNSWRCLSSLFQNC